MTLRLAWATDIHLDIAGSELASFFVDEVNEAGADVLLVGGDISNFDMLRVHLSLLATAIKCPVYFVLGNHDAYGGGIYDSKQIAKEACKDHANLHFLEDEKLVRLTEKTALVGVGGWADARTGDFFLAPGLLNDYLLIRELRFLPDRIARDVLHSFGDDAAGRLRSMLVRFPNNYEKLVVLTHTPCWRKACIYNGEISDDTWSPHFTCVAMGEAIEEFAGENPGVDVLVLSGHTHGEGLTRIASNIAARTGGAQYGSPRLVEIVIVD